jgi:hypothetical protein
MIVDREAITSKGLLEHYEATVVKDTALAKKAAIAKEATIAKEEAVAKEAVAKEAGQAMFKFSLIRVAL